MSVPHWNPLARHRSGLGGEPSHSSRPLQGLARKACYTLAILCLLAGGILLLDGLLDLLTGPPKVPAVGPDVPTFAQESAGAGPLAHPNPVKAPPGQRLIVHGAVLLGLGGALLTAARTLGRRRAMPGHRHRHRHHHDHGAGEGNGHAHVSIAQEAGLPR